MFKLAFGVKRIGIHHHTRAQGAETGDEILNQIGHLNRHPIALGQTRFVLQPAGKVPRQTIDSVGQGVTEA